MAHDTSTNVSVRFRPTSKSLGPSHWEVLNSEYVKNVISGGDRNDDGLPVGILAIVPVDSSVAWVFDTWEGTGTSVSLDRLPEYVPGIERHRFGRRVLAASY